MLVTAKARRNAMRGNPQSKVCNPKWYSKW
jgi:hypothetical protein